MAGRPAEPATRPAGAARPAAPDRAAIRIINEPKPKWMTQTRPGGMLVGLVQSLAFPPGFGLRARTRSGSRSHPEQPEAQGSGHSEHRGAHERHWTARHQHAVVRMFGGGEGGPTPVLRAWDKTRPLRAKTGTRTRVSAFIRRSRALSDSSPASKNGRCGCWT